MDRLISRIQICMAKARQHHANDESKGDRGKYPRLQTNAPSSEQRTRSKAKERGDQNEIRVVRDDAHAGTEPAN